MLPPRPVPGEPKAPPEGVPRDEVPNPPVRPVEAPSPVVPKVLVPRDDPNVLAPVRLVPLSPGAVPNGLPREDVPVAPKDPANPVVFV